MANQEQNRITLQVDGMDCANCALGITRKLGKSGNQDIHVDFTTGEATFLLGQGCTLDGAVSDIESLGYKVVKGAENSGDSPFFTLERKFWFSLIFTLPLVTGHMIPGMPHLFHNAWFQLILCLPVFVLGTVHFGKSAWGSLKSGIPNMDVLIFIGQLSAFIYSIIGMALYSADGSVQKYLFFETTASIVTLVLLGNLLEHRSVKRTSSALDELAALLPEKARKIIAHGDKEEHEMVDASALRKGDLIQVNGGEAIPADGEIISGAGSANESMLTGESVPVGKTAGSQVIGGSVLLEGPVRVRITSSAAQGTLANIINMVKAAQREKPPVQKLADRISAWFVPVVIGISLLTFLLEYLAFGFELKDALMNAIAVLVISCPCAMGLATPTAVMVGIGRAAKSGILIRSGKVLELLDQASVVIFDKTGTLTTGNFSGLSITPRADISEHEISSILLTMEQHSSHPLASSLCALLKESNVVHGFTGFEEVKGVGIKAFDKDGHMWMAGSWRIHEESDKDHDIYLTRNSKIVACIDLKDEIKSGASELISYLTLRNKRVILLSGDREEKCRAIAAELGIKEVMAEKLPQEKLSIVTALSEKELTIMVGDGINDAPALSRAAIGISLADASKAAMHSAQLIVPGQKDLSAVKTALIIGKHSMRTIKQNLFWAFFYNVIAIPLAALGYLSPMIAALSMAFSDVIVIGNSLLLRTRKLS